MDITLDALQAYVGKDISEICGNHFASPSYNHCAHFVSHVLEIKSGMLCGDMAYKSRRTGGSIRCDEIYNNLDETGPWGRRPPERDGIFIFVISARHMDHDIMMNVPQKHVGIYHSGKVFNFSNGKHRVVVDNSVTEFHSKFKRIYTGGDISLYYGVPQ